MGWLLFFAGWLVLLVLITLFVSMSGRADRGAPESRIPEPATRETWEFFAHRPFEDGGCWCESCNTVDADEAVIDLRPDVEAEIAELFDSDPDVRRRRARVFPDGVIR